MHPQECQNKQHLISSKKKKVNSFINSKFFYGLLIWMFTSRGCNKRMDKIHERLLRLIFSDHESSFYDILSTLNKKTIYQRCTDVLLNGICTYLNDLSPELMSEVFHLRQNHYNLHNLNVFAMDDPCNKFMLNSTVYGANQL